MSSSTDDRVRIGRIGRPHGIRGEVTVVPDTDDLDRFAPGSELHTGGGAVLVVASARPYRDRGLIVAFEGVPDRNSAEELRGAILVAIGARHLRPGEWRPSDVIGGSAVDESGSVLGTVTDVVLGAAQDRLVVTTDAGEDVEVPFVDDLVDDPEGGRIVIRPPEGLFP